MCSLVIWLWEEGWGDIFHIFWGGGVSQNLIANKSRGSWEKYVIYYSLHSNRQKGDSFVIVTLSNLK